MTTLRHLAHAVGSTGAEEPPYRVELSTGGHRLLADEPLAEGGGDLGPSPMSLLVSALAACTATTLRIYSARKGWDLASISVDVRFNLAESGETSIQRTITVPPSLLPDQRLRLADIAERTPVTLTIRTPISTTFLAAPQGDGAH